MSTPRSAMSHVEIQELLGAYALDAVEPETAVAVEEHLNDCLRCSVEVAQHHEVAGLLANSGGTAPASLWDGIADQLAGTSDQSWDRLAARLETPGEERQLRPAAARPASNPVATSSAADTGVMQDERAGAGVIDISSARHRRSLPIGIGLVAAAAAVIALVFGVQVHHLNGRVSALQAEPQLSAAERTALAAPSTRKVTLVATGPDGVVTTPATVVLTAAGTGFVVDDADDGLPPLPSDRTYQLWGVVGKRTISLGLLGSHPGIVPFSVAGSVPATAFAITEEVAGGVVSSVNPAVAVGSVRV